VPWLVGGAVVLAAVAFAVFRLASSPAPVLPAQAALAPKADEAGAERLVGRWLRPDGGYVLDIRRAQVDGRLDASYFNPRPINVSRAEWRREGGQLRVFIELRDVNYPGSTYTLGYVPE